jgi:hypothetical protein
MKKLLAFPLILLLALSACASVVGAPRDGQYTVKVTLTGGSGRASVSSPAEITFSDGQATAVIVWSSPNYDYMLVNGTKYTPVNTEGNSTFDIPVLLDTDMAVIADTVAMSTPHEIEYTLRFDSATLKPLGSNFPLAPMIAAAATAILIIVLASAFFQKRRRKTNKV